MNAPSPRLEVQIWSDIACPWCYLGKRRLDAALARFPSRDAVDITWRAFELDRSAPAVYPPTPNYAERLAHKYRMSAARAQQMLNEMTERGKQERIVFDFDKIAGGNTFSAHQVAVCASHTTASAVQHELAERLFRAYFSQGRRMSDAETLIELASEAGVDAAVVRAALDTETYAGAARAEEDEAAALGITGVPFFLIGRYAVEGAQSSDLLLQVLQRAWSELLSPQQPPVVDDVDAGASCGVEGCS